MVNENTLCLLAEGVFLFATRADSKCLHQGFNFDPPLISFCTKHIHELGVPFPRATNRSQVVLSAATPAITQYRSRFGVSAAITNAAVCSG
jgi:hypothetical protein